MHADHGGHRQHHREAQHRLRAPRHPRAGSPGLPSHSREAPEWPQSVSLPARARPDTSSVESQPLPGASNRAPSGAPFPLQARLGVEAPEPEGSTPYLAGGRIKTLSIKILKSPLPKLAPAPCWVGMGCRDPSLSHLILSPPTSDRGRPGGGAGFPLGHLAVSEALLHTSFIKRSPYCPLGRGGTTRRWNFAS